MKTLTKEDLAFIIPTVLFIGLVLYTGIKLAIVNPLILWK
jgi:hypothetical protein